MGIKLYPVEDGDEDKYEIFTVTFGNLWRPRAFQDVPNVHARGGTFMLSRS